MFRTAKLFSTVSMIFLFSVPHISIAADYQSMTTVELSALRGTMYNATQEEKQAFRTEWLKRVEKMSPMEKEKFLGSGSGRGKGNRSGTGIGDGSGSGKGGVSGTVSGKGRQ